MKIEEKLPPEDVELPFKAQRDKEEVKDWLESIGIKLEE